jgi:stalled ribosome alternative rescue factor ArfA
MKKRRNPAAKAVRSQQFRPRKVAARKGQAAYRRRPKHPREASESGSEEA